MDKLSEAISFATEHHTGQTRKGTVNGVRMPFIIHPMGVMKRVWQFGGTERDMIAAVLHDTLEDCPEVTPEILLERFGEQVRNTVLDLTFKDPAITKTQYLESFKKKPVQSLVIKIADRICNTADFIEIGDMKYARKYFLKAEVLFKTMQKRTKEVEAAFAEPLKIYRDVAIIAKILGVEIKY